MFTGPPDVEALHANRDIQGLLEALRYGGDPAVPRSAADALLSIGVIPTLTFLLDDVPPALAHALTAADTRLLLAGLERVEVGMRLKLLRALVRTGDERVAAVLHACLKDESNAVRKHAALHLRVLHNADSAYALADALNDDPQVCWHTVTSLRGLCHYQECIQFQRIFQRSEAPRLRATAARALGAIGDDACVQVLLEGLETAGEGLRRTILIWIGRSGNRIAAGPVLHVLNQAILYRDIETMVEAIFAIGRLRDPRPLDSIIALRTSEHLRVRMAAEGALRAICGWRFPG